jgi:hypothetical protein
MKKPVLLFTALALAAAALVVLWKGLESPPRHGPTASGSGGAPASTPGTHTPAAVAAPLIPAESKAEAPAPAAAAEPERTAAAPSGGRTLAGRVLVPAGAPADDTLRVLAFGEDLAPRQIYGTGGLLDDLADGRHAERLLGSAKVDAQGRFTLALASEARVWLAVEGRFLYSSRSTEVPAGAPAPPLEGVLGGCVRGRVRLATGVDDPVEALAELDLELQPDTDDFTFAVADLPLRRRAVLDAEGRFELRAVQTSHALELEVDSDVCADTTLGGIRPAPGEVTELDVALTLGATLRGVVRDEGGAGVEGAEVLAAEPGFWGFPGEELAQTKSDAQGGFVLAHVRAGKALLLAKHDGFLEAKGVDLELADGVDVGGLTLVLEAGASIAGHARFSDGAPAAGAKVEVDFDPAAMVGMGAMNAARGARGSATVAADGSFRVGGLGKGPFRAVAKIDRDPGEGQDEWRAKLSGIAAGTSDVRLELSAPCVLAGRVLDRSGAAVQQFRLRAHVPGAVFFEGGVTREESFTSEEGVFRLAGLDPGPWEVSARAEGFGPSSIQSVTLPQAGEPLVVVLAPAASVEGTVLDPQGSPVAGAKVAVHVDTAERLQQLRGDASEPEAVSSEDGSFLLTGLADGRRAIEARREGFATSGAVDVDLVAGETTRGVVLRLRKGALVTGEVYRGDGEPARGVRVIAQSPGGLDMSMKQADGEGRFRIENLDPGSWTITAMLEGAGTGGEGGADEASANFLGNLRFTMVQLEEGEEEHVVLGAPPKDPVLVRGRVRHGEEPVSQGMVSFFAEGSKGMEALKIAPLGADGNYEARLDQPGKYVISVQVTGGGAATFQQHTIEFRERVPEVEEHRLDFALPLGGVRGRVLGPDRQPLASTRVTLVTEGGIELGSMMGGQYSESVTDAGGEYSFPYLRPGEYAVAAGGALFGGAFGNETQAGRAVRAGLRIEEGHTLEGIDFQLDTPGSLGGRALDGAGQPVKDVSLFVRDSGGRLMDRFSMITSAADGTFEYKGLAPGEYVISARGRGLASSESAPVRVESGARASVDLVLHPGTRLVIEAVDQEGEPVEARVSVTDGQGRAVHAMVGWAEMTAIFAEGFDTGQQLVGPLPPGAYTVVATAADGKKASKPVTLDGQPERRLKLRLR